MNVDLIIKIVMYAILAIIPISVILIVFFNKTKLVQEMAKESNKKSKNNRFQDDNFLFSDDSLTSSTSYTGCAGNYFTDDKH